MAYVRSNLANSATSHSSHFTGEENLSQPVELPLVMLLVFGRAMTSAVTEDCDIQDMCGLGLHCCFLLNGCVLRSDQL